MLITQNGHSAAVLMDSAVFDELQEKLNTLAVYEDILVSEGQSARGEMLTTEELERELDEDEKTGSATNPKQIPPFLRSNLRWPYAKHQTQNISISEPCF